MTKHGVESRSLRTTISFPISLLVAATLPLACATVPANAPKYSRATNSQAGYTNVYVYRIGAYPTLRTPTIAIDEKTVFDPPEGSYTVMALPAGRHRFKVDWAWDTGWPDLVFPIVVRSEPLYIKISGSFSYAGNSTYEAGSYARSVEPAAAETELEACCRYLPPKEFPPVR
jgi:hypothetical protein